MKQQNKKDSQWDGKLMVLLIALGAIQILVLGLIFAFVGFVTQKFSPLSGFYNGASMGLILAAVGGTIVIGMFCWEWVKREANKGRLLPYVVCAFAGAVAVSSYLAIDLGKPSCEERDDAPRSSCIEYANDGFEATTNQRWHEFWNTLPVTAVIAILAAVIVHNAMHKKK